MLAGLRDIGATGGCCRSADNIETRRNGLMDVMIRLGMATLTGLLVACSTPQDRAAEAQEAAYNAQQEVAKQRLELVGKYETCMKNAAGDPQKSATCDSYLKAAEALK
jgi:hypothetical protein